MVGGGELAGYAVTFPLVVSNVSGGSVAAGAALLALRAGVGCLVGTAPAGGVSGGGLTVTPVVTVTLAPSGDPSLSQMLLRF